MLSDEKGTWGCLLGLNAAFFLLSAGYVAGSGGKLLPALIIFSIILFGALIIWIIRLAYLAGLKRGEKNG